MAENKYDAAIIGSGPGGYVCALRCAQLGLKTAIIEKNRTFGGTCLNIGCIPSKALLDSTELLNTARTKMKSHGIDVEPGNITVDLGRMMARKSQIVAKMTDGVKLLLKNNKIDAFEGSGSLKDSHSVIIEKNDGSRIEIRAESVILATGSVPLELNLMPHDGNTVVDSTDALSLDEIPGSLAVIGAGAIGLEMGSIWSRLGTRVTVIEMMDQILPLSETKTANRLAQILKGQGLDIRVSSKVVSMEKSGGKVKLMIRDKKDAQSEITCDKVLVAAGRKPFIEGLGLEKAGVQFDAKSLKIGVNKKFQTSVPGIYAIGDIIRGPMLAHKASEEGIAAAEVIASGFGEVNYDAMPNVVYTWPEYASAGKGEDELARDGISYNSGIFQFRANGRSLAIENNDGFVKILSDKKTDKILGCQIIGPWASDLIGEVVSVMEFGGSAEDIARITHAHPTLSEAVKEAAMDAGSWSIHSLPKLIKK